VEREQQYLGLLHRHLDARRLALADELEAALRSTGGTAQSRVERGTIVRRISKLIAGYDAAENGLCFGRLDLADGGRLYLGRIGLRNEDPDVDPLLVDWRAPAARAFYTATAAVPQGVRLRRHLHTRGRQVLRVDDELLDGSGDAPADVELTGEAALLAALRSERTGRMHDIVATLQAEQDRIVRSTHSGVLVVQGGPGTGKTAIALHRTAYLLYTHPRLDERGVLVIGPNPLFLGYISQVLPGLGETSVLLSTIAELYPGLTADRAESDETAEIKGRLAMADVVAAAVRARQAVVDGPVMVAVGGEKLRLEPDLLEREAERARATQLPHNQARPVFCQAVIARLARMLAGVVVGLEAQIDADLADRLDLDEMDRAVAADLAGLFGDGIARPDRAVIERAKIAASESLWLDALPRDPVVQRLLHRLWPALTPEQLLDELFADADRLAEAAPQLTAAERNLLRRAPGQGWTPADVPILDEAAELLGQDTQAAQKRQKRERSGRVDYAQGVLDILRGSRVGEDDDPGAAERLTATDLLDAAQLADWHEEADPRTVAERAAADRTWSFGHVIVDEAQELPQMAWRLLLRRCPARSFTVVGDVAQAGTATGSSSWAEALEPLLGTRWRLEQLTVNYRTPAEIMAVADPVREAIDPALTAARAVRSTGVPPSRERVSASGLPQRLATLAAREAEEVGAGRVAVIVPDAEVARLAEAVRATVPDASWGAEPDLEKQTVVLTARQAKGLEFDSVVLVDPQAILDASQNGLNDLYVALTRAVQRLRILHPGAVPKILEQVPADGAGGS
jgi:DNA helicase IV